jgi:hypothetical protein
MLGFLIGTVCLVGLVKTLRWGRGGGCGYGRGFGRRWGGHGPCGGGFGGRFGDEDQFGGGRGYDEGYGGGGWGGPSMLLRMLFRELSTTPGQEKAIVAAYEEMREATKDARAEAKASRADLAKAMRGPAIDEVLFGEMFSRHDTAMEKLRRASIGAVSKVHDALDERQRARLADLIESGPGAFRRGFGGPFGNAAYPL